MLGLVPPPSLAGMESQVSSEVSALFFSTEEVVVVPFGKHSAPIALAFYEEESSR